MSYQQLIDSNLVRTFNLIKDLAQPITLIRKTGVSFNFTTSATESTSTQNISTKAILIENKKASKEHNVIEKQVMLKSKEVGDITSFDSIQISNQTWQIGDIPKDNGFILIINIYREV